MRKASLLGLGLVAVAILLAAGWVFGAGAKDTPKTEQSDSSHWRLAEPVRYENLTIFPVIAGPVIAGPVATGAGKAASGRPGDTGRFITLDEALENGDAVVTESGSAAGLRRSRDSDFDIAVSGAEVNQLVLINRGKRPLILLAGELVSGGKQDRIISKDRIVPPDGKPLPLDVFCVEQGRWSTGAEFKSAKVMVHPSVREKAAVDQAQSEVWAAVASGTTSDYRVASAARGVPAPAPTLSASAIGGIRSAAAPTTAYRQIYQSDQVGKSSTPYVDGIQKLFAAQSGELKGEVVGVVVAYGDEVAWSDLFASPALFERYWPKLLESYAVEALVRPRSKAQASLEDARNFLRPLSGHESVESEPDVYSLREVTEGSQVEITLEALGPADVALHVLKIHKTS